MTPGLKVVGKSLIYKFQFQPLICIIVDNFIAKWVKWNENHHYMQAPKHNAKKLFFDDATD